MNFSSVASGIVFGLANAFSPGPLSMLIIGQTLRYGKHEGMKVAIAPLFTDAFMILAVLAILSTVGAYESVIGTISFFGAALIFFFAIEFLRVKPIALKQTQSNPRSLSRGIVINLLNPYPYLFWMLIGGPILLQSDTLSGILFVGGFYVFFVGTNVCLALAVGQISRFMQGRGYVVLMRLLALALLYFAYMRFMEALRLFHFL